MYIDFMPEISMKNNHLEVVSEIKLRGLTIRSDLKWTTNTDNSIRKANRRLWILTCLKNLEAQEADLEEVFTKQIRCVLELAVPAWQPSLTKEAKVNLERVQKSACHIILGKAYQSYTNALEYLGLDTLENRRIKLCYNFALKSEKHIKLKSWYKPAKKYINTRLDTNKYCDVRANHTRFANSPLSYLTRILNKHHNKKQ